MSVYFAAGEAANWDDHDGGEYLSCEDVWIEGENS